MDWNGMELHYIVATGKNRLIKIIKEKDTDDRK